MPSLPAVFVCLDPAQTADLATRLAPYLEKGDVLLLQGDLGSGKTHFARALITALLPEPEEVPSPSFPLVQVYHAAAFDIWHVDLYRLDGAGATTELGLEEAFETALCLVEWPDRLQRRVPLTALTLTFAMGETEFQRRITLRWQHPKWGAIVKRLADDF